MAHIMYWHLMLLLIKYGVAKCHVSKICSSGAEAAGEEKVGSVLVFLKYKEATGVFYSDSHITIVLCYMKQG